MGRRSFEASTISTLTVSRLKCASVKSLIFKMKILLLLLVTAAFVAARAEKLECYIGEPSQNQTKQCTNDDDVCLTEYRGECNLILVKAIEKLGGSFILL